MKLFLEFYRQIAVAAERALQRILDNERALIPAPARVMNWRRFDGARSRD